MFNRNEVYKKMIDLLEQEGVQELTGEKMTAEEFAEKIYQSPKNAYAFITTFCLLSQLEQEKAVKLISSIGTVLVIFGGILAGQTFYSISAYVLTLMVLDFLLTLLRGYRLNLTTEAQFYWVHSSETMSLEEWLFDTNQMKKDAVRWLFCFLVISTLMVYMPISWIAKLLFIFALTGRYMRYLKELITFQRTRKARYEHIITIYEGVLRKDKSMTTAFITEAVRVSQVDGSKDSIG